MRPLVPVSLTFMLVTVPLAAQEGEPPDTSRDVLILDHDFTFSGEFARVMLVAGEAYRAEATVSEFRISLKLVQGGQEPFLSREQFQEPPGRTIVLIYPHTTGTYQVELVEGGPVVTLRIYRDLRASHRRQRIATHPGWEIGGELALGGHDRYRLADPDAPSAFARDDGGTAGSSSRAASPRVRALGSDRS